MKKAGYAYWGFLGDEKRDLKGNKLSTPDGNAFYSWSIINSLQEDGYEVYQMMPNRDAYCNRLLNRADNFKLMGFESYDELNNPRYRAYVNMYKNMYSGINSYKNVTQAELFHIWDVERISELDFILLEWRMEIPGRNTLDCKHEDGWQPDLFIQDNIIKYCAKNNIKLVIFDLDYKLTEEHINTIKRMGVNLYVIELGHKWEKKYEDKNNGKRFRHVEIPFDFRYIDNYNVISSHNCLENLVYVGNRYERDWCVDKYIPTEMNNVILYGNWLEGGRDSKERWPLIEFGERIGIDKMKFVYNNSVCTILFAKQEYTEYGFMTVRVIESLYYGTVPLFIEEYGKEIIQRYAGPYAYLLTVGSKKDVIDRVMYFKYNDNIRKEVIKNLRWRLRFMDSSLFVSELEEIIK
jgi:hypothetical protein